MKVLQPPSSLEKIEECVLFLGGSIEMGAASRWQDRVINALSDKEGTILNPRRDDWDSSWEQDPTPGTKFHEQVMWELNGQETADILTYYFDPNTKSPITLLELGLGLAWSGMFENNQQIRVYCPKTFWRYGNVKMVCDRFDISVYEDEALYIEALRDAV